MDLGQCPDGIEPVEGLGNDHGIHGATRQRDRLGRPLNDHGRWHGFVQLRTHALNRLQRQDPRPGRDQEPRQLAGPGSQLQDRPTRPEVECAGQGRHRLRRVRGARALIRVRADVKPARGGRMDGVGHAWTIPRHSARPRLLRRCGRSQTLRPSSVGTRVGPGLPTGRQLCWPHRGRPLHRIHDPHDHRPQRPATRLPHDLARRGALVEEQHRLARTGAHRVDGDHVAARRPSIRLQQVHQEQRTPLEDRRLDGGDDGSDHAAQLHGSCPWFPASPSTASMIPTIA